MDSKQFRQIQAYIGCTGKQLASWLGLADETVSQYRNGHKSIPGPVALSMEALSTGWRPSQRNER